VKVLVCGGRGVDSYAVWEWLERISAVVVADILGTHARITHVIQGGASGADEGAARWAKSEGIRCTEYRANWKKHGKAAGPIRNQEMLDKGRPDLVIAFPGGRGTRDMVRRAEGALVPVYHVQHGEMSA
jgi:hypothetical protein